MKHLKKKIDVVGNWAVFIIIAIVVAILIIGIGTWINITLSTAMIGFWR